MRSATIILITNIIIAFVIIILDLLKLSWTATEVVCRYESKREWEKREREKRGRRDVGVGRQEKMKEK